MRTYDIAVLSLVSQARMQEVGRDGTADAPAAGRFDAGPSDITRAAVVAATETA